jgi:hypothetical protein
MASMSLLVFAATGCNEAHATSPDVVASKQALDLKDAKEVAKECGLVCPGDTTKDGIKVRGIAEGNAAIAGVSSVDAFFAAVLHFQQASQSVSEGIDAQIAAIRADFGIAADADIVTELKARFAANAEAGIKIEHEPPRCSADVKATIDAQAHCDAQFQPGKAMVACKGDCELEASASASCDAQSDLECTLNAPSIACQGSCRGSCEAELSAAASCDGTCNGSCSGTCSAYVMDSSGNAQCAGQCSGMCTGKCQTQLAGTASCSGKCQGECVLMNPSGGCTGSIQVKCKARANAMVMCSGRCESDFEPPKAKAECEASVKADAKCHMHCTPPRVVARYKSRADASIALAERARFDGAVKTLTEVRLPALLAESRHGTLVVQAGTDLTAAAQGAVRGSFNEALAGKLSVQEAFGLGCAVNELPKVDAIVSESNNRLNQSLQASSALTAMLGG